MPQTDRQTPLPLPACQALMPQPDRQAPLPQPACRAFLPSPDRLAPLLPPARQALMPQLDRQAPLPQPVCQVPTPQPATGSRASAGMTGPLLIPGIVPLVGVLRLEPCVGEGELMFTPSPASRSPGCSLWRTPVTIVMHTWASSDSPGLHHLPDYLPNICHSLEPVHLCPFLPRVIVPCPDLEKGPRSKCELEINLPGTPIPDEVPDDLTFPIARSSCIDIRDSIMQGISTSDLRTKMMTHTDEALHRNSPRTDSNRQSSAKASLRFFTPSCTSKGTSLVTKGVGIDMEEKEGCYPSSSGHLRELFITSDISSATAFPLQSLMDSSKEDFICLVTILVIRLLPKIGPSALDGPSQQAVDMTAIFQQLIRQVLSEFCVASGFSRTQAHPQDLHIHTVFRGVHKNLLDAFGSYNALQATLASQDSEFDRVLVKSLPSSWCRDQGAIKTSIYRHKPSRPG
ncbi:uncharacterized protein [Salmo salar]|uniref:Uncharacterized protein n=1 Tax=Salmo salar TaxID=8030 RepID=A0ABM3DJL8_SALSA|nr:uncharacterized protein LOC123729139 [Salmo salar]